MSEEEKWWHPNKLPPSGYQSNISQDHDRKSFYPFNSELGYRIFKRIIEMKRTGMEQQNNEENTYRPKYFNQMNKDERFLLKQGVCSQKPNSSKYLILYVKIELYNSVKDSMITCLKCAEYSESMFSNVR